MRGIYSQDVFMESSVGKDLSDALYFFVRSYVYQAYRSHQLNLKYFSLIPKLHWIHETAHALKRESELASHCQNPAIFSCSMDEDFIGRCAALSRCVSPRLVPKRLFERYLAHIHICWARAWKGERRSLEGGFDRWRCLFPWRFFGWFCTCLIKPPKTWKKLYFGRQFWG